jgi:hypothetical protein
MAGAPVNRDQFRENVGLSLNCYLLDVLSVFNVPNLYESSHQSISYEQIFVTYGRDVL